jgi:hypothetical protein
MATTCITNAFRQGSLQKDLDYTDQHQIALYDDSGHDQTTGAYTATEESSGSGYSAKGETLANGALAVNASENVAYLTWDDVTWTSSSITATDCMIFNEDSTSPAADTSVYIGDFNGSKTTTNGTFEVLMPTAAYNTAIVRFA